MTLHLVVPAEIEQRLRAKAGEAGQSVDDYVSKLLATAVTSPTLDELLDPVRRDFAAAGLNEDQLMDLGRQELEAMRKENDARGDDLRAVYDSMVVFQWAALPPGREHATIRLLQSGQIRLCMSASLLGEIRGILSRPRFEPRLRT